MFSANSFSLVKHRCNGVFFKLVASAVLIGATIWSNNEVCANEIHDSDKDQMARIQKVARSWLLVEDNFSVYSLKAKEIPKKGRDLKNIFIGVVIFSACW